MSPRHTLLQTSLVLALALIINIFRFIGLNDTPSGFMFDETTSGVTFQCLLENGSAPLQAETHYPLFTDVGIGNPKPPTYTFPGMLWTSIMGTSPEAIRGFTVFMFLLALIGLFATGWHFGGICCGSWVFLAASISPWTWTYTRVGWESPLILTYFIWGVFIALRARKTWAFILSGILFAAAAYTYPPGRLQIPVFLVLMIIFTRKSLPWNWQHISCLLGTFFAAQIPLAYNLLSDPAMTSRLHDVALTNPEYLKKIGRSGNLFDLAAIIIDNIKAHLSPSFLFLHGSVHDMGVTTGRQGILSWLDSMALLIALSWTALKWHQKKELPSKTTLWLMLFLALNFIIGMMPAIITKLVVPHTGNNLRSIQAWPFAMFATGFIIHKASMRWPVWGYISSLAVALIFTLVFLGQYFKFYPKDSVLVFSAWIRAEAKAARTDEDWMKFLYRHHKDPFASRYFLSYYKGLSCSDARNTYNKLAPFFKRMQESGQTPVKK